MIYAILILLLMGLLIAGILIGPIWDRRRRDRLKRQPFPPLWTALIEQHLPIYDRLNPPERRQLQGHIQIFLAEKQFIGCGGLQVTEEMRVVIAAIANLLVLHQTDPGFPKLRSILIYPSTYWVQATKPVGKYVVEEERVARLGESWTRDQVVLSWAQIQRDMAHWHDGHNVVLHEFAHQLDQADGQAEGVPILPNAADYEVWAQVMTQDYQQLCRDVQRGVKTVFDPYGATSPAEFFAVATETFFEQPTLLQRHHPALYQQLQRYYQLDPLQWR